jgi:hypothetical protein
MSRTQRSQHRAVPRTALALAVTAGSLACAQTATAATTPVGGGAFAVQASVNALVVPLDVGPLPSVSLPSTGSDPVTASLLNTNVLGLVTVKAGNVSTEGKGDPGTATSSATVANVDVAGLVRATVANSSCTATTSGATGAAKVVDLVVAGIPLAIVDIGPNTKISLPVGTVTINEQVKATGANQGITVNAVHVHLSVLGIVTGDVILAQSRCSVG